MTPIHFLYSDVPPVRVSFSESSFLNRVYDFTFSCLRQVSKMNIFCVLNTRQGFVESAEPRTQNFC